MKKTINKVQITGELVKNTLKEFETKNGTEAISGEIILRTAVGSEHEISLYANKYKKDSNKQFTNEINKLYASYSNAIQNYKDLEHCDEGEVPDVISVTDGMFVDNDFKSKNGDVISKTESSARFIDLVSAKNRDSVPREAKFEVEGIVANIDNEIKNDKPTGNLEIILNAIGQKAEGFGKDAKYEPDKLIPIKMIVPKELVEGFNTVGYYVGCYAKFTGLVINTVEMTTTTEKQAFGEPITKTIRTYIVRNEIVSGSEPSTIFEHELTQEMVDTLIAKRKQKLVEVAQGVDDKSKSAFTPDKSKPAPSSTYNPFAQG